MKFSKFTYLFIACALSYGNIAFANQSQMQKKISSPNKMLQIPTAQVPSHFIFSYKINVRLNGRNLTHPIEVQFRKDGYYVDNNGQQALFIPKQQRINGWLNLNKIKGVSVNYLSKKQQLDIRVPLNWLPLQIMNNNSNHNAIPYTPSLGLTVDYDSYYTNIPQEGQSVNTSLAARLFGAFGYLLFSGNVAFEAQPQLGASHWSAVRGATSWVYNDPRADLTWVVGDNITQQGRWFNAVHMAGISLYKNYNLDPNFITSPTFNLKGSAAVPSTVDLFINGLQVQSQQVNSGPFVINNVPFINGAGQADIVTTDKFGRKTTTQVSFYDANNLLGKGVDQYEFNLGWLHYNPDSRQSYYKHPMFTGSYRIGLSNHLTGMLHSEAAQHLALVGVGAETTLSQYGLLFGSVSDSYHKLQNSQGEFGTKFTLGYSYTNHSFSVQYQHQSYSRYFMDLANYETNNTADSEGLKDTDSLITSTGLGSYSVGVGYFHMNYRKEASQSLTNLSLSHSLGQYGVFSCSVNRNFSTNNDLLFASLSIPFGNNSSASFASNYNSQHQLQNSIQLQHNASYPTGIGWSIDYQPHQSENLQAQVNWNTQYTNLIGGIYSDNHQYTPWAELSGSVSLMDGQLAFTQQNNDAMLLVDTNGIAGVPVSYNGFTQGTTNSKGFLFIPNVISNIATNVTIDPQNLAANISVPQTKALVRIPTNSGAVAKFNLRKIMPITLRVEDAQHHDLPIGSLVEVKGLEDTFVGLDGEIYLPLIAKQNTVTISYGNNKQCHFNYIVKDVTQQDGDTVICNL